MTQTELAAYDIAAPDWFRRIEALGYHTAYLDLLERHAPSDLSAKDVLDAGCGTGDFAVALQAARGTFRSLTLLDPAAEMLAIAHARLPQSQPRYGVIDDLAPVPSFDLILSAHALEHCADLTQSLATLAKTLRDGGHMILVLSKPHWCNLLIWLRWRHRILPARKVRIAAHLAGLHIGTEHPFPSGPPSRTSRAYVLRRSRGRTLS